MLILNKAWFIKIIPTVSTNKGGNLLVTFCF